MNFLFRNFSFEHSFPFFIVCTRPPAGPSMSDETTPLGSLVQWMAITGLMVHIMALVWGCWVCCRRREQCPFTPSTRVDAGRQWAWMQQHPQVHSQPSYEGPRRRQSGQGLAGLIRRQGAGNSNLNRQDTRGERTPPRDRMSRTS